MKVELGNIRYATIQMVGNKAKGEGVTFAYEMSDMAESSDFIKTLVGNTFHFDDLRHFDFIESLALNPVYSFVRQIFEDKSCFVKQSNNLARYLYDQSLHPNIKNGEYYIILINDVSVDEIKTEALLMFKSEKKDSFLTVKNEGGKLCVKPTVGIGLKQVDKGCLVFNIHKEDGYVVAIVDNTNKSADAHYWTDSFLHAVPFDDDFHKTKLMFDFCSGFARLMKKERPAQEFETLKAFSSVAEMFRDEHNVSLQQLEELMCFSCDASFHYADYKAVFEKENGALPLSFHVSTDSSKVNNRLARMRTMRVGNEFEIKVLNPAAQIENGYDSDKKKSFYKLYYDQ